MIRRTAVIGAGLAGLACARVLRRAGCFVEMFEADRIIGGRMATTRVALTPFDHGAQYITARSAGFRAFIDELVATGYAARWQPTAASGEASRQLLPWYVGTPGMSSMVRPLAEGVRIATSRRVYTMHRDQAGWHLVFEDQTIAGPYQAVAVAVPAAEAVLLLGRLDALASRLERVRMSPCWSLLVRLDDRVLPAQDVYSDMSEVIRWIARNNAKPSRAGRGDQIVVHASPAWSRETEDVDPDEVAAEMWNEVCHVLSLPPVRPAHLSAVLWRRGLVEESLGETCVYAREHRVGVAGDWCLGRLAEHAFESGTGLGRVIVESLD